MLPKNNSRKKTKIKENDEQLSVCEEAAATVRKKNGKYFDLSKISLVNKGLTKLNDRQFLDLFKNLRLRFDLTSQCNAWCVFCSNEGSNYTSKRGREAKIEDVIYLSELLINNTPLKSIDFSGGEPTIHSDFASGKFKLAKWTKKYPRIRFSIHSNGITLTPTIVDQLKNSFSRIGISIHSLNFATWNKITNLNNFYPLSAQKIKFNNLLNNLKYIAKQNIGEKIFIKSVIMRGLNDSPKELSAILKFCEKNNFHPKFLEFEPQYPEHEKFIVGRKELFAKLEKLGCHFSADAPRHNDPNRYIPGVNFSYHDQKGLHSIFGCGDKAACESCYLFLCMFVKPLEDGRGLYLKPCPPLDTRFDLSWALAKKNKKQILDIFKMSREYLMMTPGVGIKGWNKEEKYLNTNLC
jgi:molybdenum cofactor biosynthesis enzyme MoaA